MDYISVKIHLLSMTLNKKLRLQPTISQKPVQTHFSPEVDIYAFTQAFFSPFRDRINFVFNQ